MAFQTPLQTSLCSGTKFIPGMCALPVSAADPVIAFRPCFISGFSLQFSMGSNTSFRHFCADQCFSSKSFYLFCCRPLCTGVKQYAEEGNFLPKQINNTLQITQTGIVLSSDWDNSRQFPPCLCVKGKAFIYSILGDMFS